MHSVEISSANHKKSDRAVDERFTMNKIKAIDYEILKELLKNCRRSDRELARALRVSQPTVTRRRTNVEKSYIDGYTVIPKWKEVGLEVIAFSFVKHKIKFAKPEVMKETFKIVEEWMSKQPNVILAIDGQGMGWDAVFVSLHKNYTDFVEFMRKHDNELSEYLIERESFVSVISPMTVKKPFHLKYLEKLKW
jgi:DNA-binding Lrp family transcriptional regulator